MLAMGEEFSILGRMVNEKRLKAPIFSVFLSKTDDELSEVTFGEVKQEHAASELVWIPVSGTSGFWEMRIDDITVGDKPLGVCGAGCRVAIDTGDSHLRGPPKVVGAIKSKLNVQKDCSNYMQLPKLGFMVDGHILNLEPQEYIENQ